MSETGHGTRAADALGPAPTKWRRRLTAAGTLLLALAGMAATLVLWRADTADRRGDFARAAWWRPGVAMYRRQWAETLLVSSPAEAERELLAGLRLDPYDPLSLADLTTAELAVGNWPRALVVTSGEQHREPSFADYWRLANLYLTHGETAGYWQQVANAAALASPGDFSSIVSRSLTLAGPGAAGDFVHLRRVLPPDSVVAASAYLSAAVAAGNLDAARDGAAWLMGLPPPSDTGQQQLRRQAMLQFLTAAWERWPAMAGPAGEETARHGLVPGPAKTAAAPYLHGGDFNPAQYSALRRTAPDPASSLSAILGWSWSQPTGVDFDPVLTGDAAYPTAAELSFDGSEADDVELPEQWILAPGGATLAISASGRALGEQPADGVSLRLTGSDGRVVGDMPLQLGPIWRVSWGRFILPAGGVAAYRLSLHYHRPSGQLPLENRILVTGVTLR